MGYINKEDAIKAIVEHPSKIAIFTEKAIQAIRELPTPNVAEVVRCKNCEYLLKDLSDRQAHLCMRNPFCRMNVKLDDFCSYGERKEGE